MSEMKNLGVWSELYRPQTIDDCILPADTKQSVKDVIATGNIPSFVFAGHTGTGKTTLGKAIANDVGADLLYINASRETSIDMIRDRVVGFASTCSFDGNLRMILLDEVDGLSPKAMDSLKGIYEEFPKVRFILTTNSVQKIIKPILGRSTVVVFKADAKERPKLAVAMMKRIIGILKERNVEYEPKVIAELVNKYFPDFRATMNALQWYAAKGRIDSSALLAINDMSIAELINAMRDKNFKIVRTWVGEHSGDGSATVYANLYENAFEYFTPQSIPTLIVTLSRYDFESQSPVNPQINLCACLTEIMAHCTFKE